MPETLTANAPGVSGLQPHARMAGSEAFQLVVFKMLAGHLLLAWGFDGTIAATDG